jgi:Zn-dependent protease
MNNDKKRTINDGPVLRTRTCPKNLAKMQSSGRNLQSDGFEGELDPEGNCHGVWVLKDDAGCVEIELKFEHGKLNGTQTQRYADGSIAMEIPWQLDMVHGTLRRWDQNGNLVEETEYVDDVPHGVSTVWYQDGRKTVWNFAAGSLHGSATELDSDGNASFNQRFVHGIWVEPWFANLTSILSGRQIASWIAVAAFVIFAWMREPYIIVGFLMLGVCVAIHELGHWLVARIAGIPTSHFVVGVGPTLVSFVLMRTVITIKAIPIIGYVAPYNIRRSEFDCYHAWKRGVPQSQWPPSDPKESPNPATYFVNRFWQLTFYLGGVAANFLLAATIIWVTVSPGNPLKAFQDTAKISVRMWGLLPQAVAEQFSWQTLSTDRPGLLRGVRDSLQSGYPVGPSESDQGQETHADATAVENADETTIENSEQSPTQPIMQKISPWLMFALINIIFVAFNLLPIPPLDGFRCAVVLIEAVIRRPMPIVALTVLNWIGISMIGLLCISGLFILARDVFEMLR